MKLKTINYENAKEISISNSRQRVLGKYIESAYKRLFNCSDIPQAGKELNEITPTDLRF